MHLAEGFVCDSPVDKVALIKSPTALFRDIWNEKHNPLSRRRSLNVPISKKGMLSACNSQHGTASLPWSLRFKSQQCFPVWHWFSWLTSADCRLDIVQVEVIWTRFLLFISYLKCFPHVHTPTNYCSFFSIWKASWSRLAEQCYSLLFI